MNLRQSLLAALLITAFSAHATTYSIRISSPGVKAVPVEQPAAPAAPVVPPQVSLSPAAWDFGTVAANQAVPKSFTLSNAGAGKASLSFGALAAPFYLDTGNCADELLPQASCTFAVTFQSSTVQTSSSATLSITQGGGAAPVSAALSGATSSGVQGNLVLDVPGIVYRDGGNTVNRANGALDVNVDFYRSKSAGKWYFETQSTGTGAISVLIPNGAFWMDVRYRGMGSTGSGITPSTAAYYSQPSTSRFGWAVDVEARTGTIYDVSTCAVLRSVTWTISGAVRPQLNYRASIDPNTDTSAFFAPSGKTCIPAGYSWWNNN